MIVKASNQTTADREAQIPPEHILRNTMGVVLAGGKGMRLGTLTRSVCKPALPFGAQCRTIDFTLSNCVNSGIRKVGVVTQYQEHSLLEHISRVWENKEPDQSVLGWPAWQTSPRSGYVGTADAVYRNWDRIEAFDASLVLVLAGDHIYKMDYRPMIQHHLMHNADATVACVEVPVADASKFGVMAIGSSTRIVHFAEKPVQPVPIPGRSNHAMASMGIYIFNRDFLGQRLLEDAGSEMSSHDFGHDLIPRMVRNANLFAYSFSPDAKVGSGYWCDVGTVPAYWQAHMDLLRNPAWTRLDNSDWPVRCEFRLSRPEQHPNAVDSILGPGCSVAQANVRRSVLYPGVTVGAHTTLANAVVLPGTQIGQHCHLNGVVIEPNVVIPDGMTIGQFGHRQHILDQMEPVLVNAEMIASAGNRINGRNFENMPRRRTQHPCRRTHTGG